MRAAEARTLHGADPTEAQVTVVSKAKTYLAPIRKRLTRRDRVTVDTAVWYGPAAHAIVEAVRIRKVDQIVMTTHGRSGLRRLLLGSVAESVRRGTTTPLLLLRTEGAAGQTPSGAAKPWEAP